MAYGTVNADVIGTSVSGSNLGPGNATVFKNRIINGDMRIDQRNAGASVAVLNTINTFITDRWSVYENSSGAFSWQQVSDAPDGFINSLKCTITTANSSPAAGDLCQVKTTIEGLNIADLGWGTANAKTVTLSFWVKSSLTGQFGGAFINSSTTRSYPFSYTISSANTWEQKSITIIGDTTGTWLTTNGIGIYVVFDMGMGSTYLGPAGSWAAADYRAATGDTKLIATNGATFYITGVQLEVGSSATGFEYMDYGRQLAQCQRYYYRTTPVSLNIQGVGGVISTTSARVYTQFPVTMRTPPTALEQSGTASDYALLQAAAGIACSSVPTFLTASIDGAQTTLTVASGATVASYAMLRNASVNSYLGWSAEL